MLLNLHLHKVLTEEYVIKKHNLKQKSTKRTCASQSGKRSSGDGVWGQGEEWTTNIFLRFSLHVVWLILRACSLTNSSNLWCKDKSINFFVSQRTTYASELLENRWKVPHLNLKKHCRCKVVVSANTCLIFPSLNLN